MRTPSWSVLAAATTMLFSIEASAKIVRVEIARIEPAFAGQSFDPVGPYERVVGKAYGEVDPADPLSAVIQDIALAPKNARGRVEYVTDIDILRPKDVSRGNGVLFFNIVNRGNKGGLVSYNAGAGGSLAENNGVARAGDGHMMREGYTLVWFGWQADVLPGDSRVMLKVPVAKNPDGSSITGVVRAELITRTSPVKTLNLSSSWFTAFTHASYATANADNRAPFADGFLPTLTVRRKQHEPGVQIPNAEWSFGACPEGGEPTKDDTRICYGAGFQPGRLYELVYRAKDPLVLGLGLAATRDLASFLKNDEKDETGTPNPVFRAGNKALFMGSSQSGRFMRSFLHLGFNQDEARRIAFEGAFPHIGGALIPINVRFGQPGRGWGDQVDHLYPAYDFPFSYARQKDPITGREQGLLDRCTATGTCPRIVHAATALEIWEGRQSLGFTDPLGQTDVADPENVRTYIMASTQHAVAPLPLPAKEPFGFCQQQSNPNPQVWTMRALLAALTGWVRDDKLPPPSVVPKIADRTLVAADQVRFPFIPANQYGGVNRPAVKFLAAHNPLHVLDFGAGYRSQETSGVITQEPPRVGAATYGVLVPQVDQDGNDVAGVRSLALQVPIGTYTGWNLFNASYFQDGFCSLSGSFIPFAATKAERLATGDQRLSLEERYPTKDAYVVAVRAAAQRLVDQRFLLPADAARLIGEADAGGLRSAP